MLALVVRTLAFLPLAQATGRRRDLIWNPQLLIASLWLVGILLAAAAVVAVINRWRRNSRVDRLSASDQLAQYRTLYEQGELSREEFERLRGLLGGQLRRLGGEGAVPKAAPLAALDERTIAAPETTPAPHNPLRPPEPPETGIRPV
jgi:hypothetical protein